MTKHNHITHWPVVPLKRFLHIQGSAGSNSDKQVGLENIESWTGRHVETGSSFDGAGTAFQPQDILFGKLRPYLAKAMIAREAGSAVGDLWVLRPGEDCIPEFALYQLLDPTMIDEINSSTTGAKMPRAEWQTVGALKRPFPSRSMQKEIVAYLDGETRRIDDLIAEKNSFITLLREKRVAAISHAVTKGIDKSAPMKPSGQGWLGDVPAHWDAVPANWLFRPSKKLALPDDQLLSATQKYGVIPLTDFEKLEGRKVTLAVTNLDKRKHVEVGDFVISMRSMDGGLERARARGSVRSSYTVLKFTSEVDGRFYGYLLKSKLFIQALRLTANFIRDGQDMHFGHFRAVKLPRLPLAEQDAIANHLDRETARIDSLISETERSIDLLKEKRAALITAAVTGKINVGSAA